MRKPLLGVNHWQIYSLHYSHLHSIVPINRLVFFLSWYVCMCHFHFPRCVERLVQTIAKFLHNTFDKTSSFHVGFIFFLCFLQWRLTNTMANSNDPFRIEPCSLFYTSKAMILIPCFSLGFPWIMSCAGSYVSHNRYILSMLSFSF